MGVDPNVAIIGAGPAGLMAAEVLLEKGIAEISLKPNQLLAENC